MAVISPLVNLDSLQAVEREAVAGIAGGKGYGLWTLAKLALPYPATWVVTAAVFEEFRQQVAVADQEEILARAEEFVADRVMQELRELPDCLYAVRSSAGVEDSAEKSFAGMFVSVLHVKREEIPAAVASVWASCLGERVRQYCGEVLLPGMAVLLQPMVNARLSGVCFTINPSPTSAAENDAFLIEMVPGLGETLVQGETTPVRLTGSFGALATCSDYPWLPELLLAAMRLTEETGSPVDLEFAVDEAEKLWILQQRPVTRVGYSHVLDMSGYKKAYKRALCSLDIEFLIDGCIKFLASYLEVPANLDRWMVMLTNENDGQQELWVNERLDEAVVRMVGARIAAEPDYLERLRARYAHHHRRILAWQETAWADSGLPLAERLYDFFEFIGPINAHYYAPMHIIEALSALLLRVMRSVDATTADDDFFAIVTADVVSLGHLFAAECEKLNAQLCQSMGGVPADPASLPEQLAACLEDMEERYGFLNCHQPYEEPYGAEAILQLIMDASAGREKDTCCGNESIDVAAIAQKYRDDAQFNQLAAWLKFWLEIRNQKMEYLYYIYAKAGPLFDEVGAALGRSREDVWKMDRASIIRSLRGDSACRISDSGRPAIFHDGRQVVLRENLRVLQAHAEVAGGTLTGRAVYGSGKLTGTVKVAFTPEALEELGQDTENLIVVTGMTTPDFVPLMMKKAVALITDEGGILCHAAIIAREMRMPCIVGTGSATERLQDGMTVVIDLDRGLVKIGRE